MIKNIHAKEAPDIRGIVFRIVVFLLLLIAICVILEGCAPIEQTNSITEQSMMQTIINGDCS
jgi:hypothetical protein